MKIKLISIIAVLFLSIVLFSCGNTENNNSNQNEDTTLVSEQIISENETTDEEETVEEQISINETNNKDAFDYLEKLAIDKQSEIFIKYNSASTTVINKKLGELDKNDPLFDDEYGEYDIKLIKTKINSTDYFNVVFSWGASGDPNFTFYNSQTNQSVFTVYALNLYITGNGNIYTAGHTNNDFNTRKKYIYQNNTFKEVEQPYYYVGLQTKTLKPVTLYKTEDLKNSIANLPANYNIEVLLNKKETSLYLIKTDFGLIGWVKVISSMQGSGNGNIAGIYYAGD